MVSKIPLAESKQPHFTFMVISISSLTYSWKLFPDLKPHFCEQAERAAIIVTSSGSTLPSTDIESKSFEVSSQQLRLE